MNRKDFEAHLDIRHNRACYTCEHCVRWDEKREYVEDHIRRRHTKYKCDQCNKRYKREEDLEEHKKRRHTKECAE